MSHFSACPKCGSHNSVSMHRAKKFGGMVGMIGGGMSGASGMWAGAKTGVILGAGLSQIVPTSPPYPLSLLAGAVLGGLAGAAAGGLAGAKLGQEIDRHLLDNCQCLDCGYAFSSQD